MSNEQTARNTDFQAKRKARTVSRERAGFAAQRLIDSHFNNLGRDRPRISIPPSLDDDDVVLFDYLDQVASLQSQLESAQKRAEFAEVALKNTLDWKESATRELQKVDRLKALLPSKYLGWDVYDATIEEMGQLRIQLESAQKELEQTRAERDLLMRAKDAAKELTKIRKVNAVCWKLYVGDVFCGSHTTEEHAKTCERLIYEAISKHFALNVWFKTLPRVRYSDAKWAAQLESAQKEIVRLKQELEDEYSADREVQNILALVVAGRDESEAQNKLLKEALTIVYNYFWGRQGTMVGHDVRKLAEDALASIPGSKEDNE